MIIYDGSLDKKAPQTNHTAAAVSCNKVLHYERDSMTIRKNGREDWSLFFCEQGKMYFDDKELREGEIWIYEPNVPQKYVIYSKDETIYRYLHFTGNDVATLLNSLDIPCRNSILPKRKIVVEIFDHIRDDVLNGDTLSMLDAEYNILRLISKISSNRESGQEINIMKRITDNMEHSFFEPYDAQYYADMLKISVDRFNHLFKETVGISPYAYYSKIRIDNACMLLENTDLKIKDVAERSGYNDALYFTQAFKKHTGLTPSAYKKIHLFPLDVDNTF